MKREKLESQPRVIFDVENTTFKDFVQSIVRNERKQAAYQLQLLLELDLVSATAASNHFYHMYQQSPEETLQITMGIRAHIYKDDNNKALLAIITLFGFDGPEAIATLEYFKERA